MQKQSGDQKLLKKKENSGNPSEINKKSRLEIAEEIRMKRRTLSGTCGVGVFAIAFVAIALAFATPRYETFALIIPFSIKFNHNFQLVGERLSYNRSEVGQTGSVGSLFQVTARC